MSSVLANKEDQIRSFLYAKLRSVQAPEITADPCDDSEIVGTVKHAPDGVKVSWERIGFETSTCDYAGRVSAHQWEWKALVRWNCRVSVSHYLDELTKDPLIVDGARNAEGRMVSPATVVRLTQAEQDERPAQDAQIGPGLVLTFEVKNNK